MIQKHAPRVDEHDMRPGWVRDQDAGIPLNLQQLYAARSRGILRVPNFMTLFGIALNIVGASDVTKDRPYKALAAFTASFLCDMEGMHARRYGVDDPLWGARSDQGADFVKAGITVASLVHKKILPWSAAALTFGPKAASAVVGANVTRKTGKTLQSSAAGKDAEFIRDVVPIAFLAASAVKMVGYDRTSHVIRAFGWGSAAASLIVGIHATVGYAKEATIMLRQTRDA